MVISREQLINPPSDNFTIITRFNNEKDDRSRDDDVHFR